MRPLIVRSSCIDFPWLRLRPQDTILCRPALRMRYRKSAIEPASHSSLQWKDSDLIYCISHLLSRHPETKHLTHRCGIAFDIFVNINNGLLEECEMNDDKKEAY